MAVTDYTDFVFDKNYYHTGLFEGLTQNLQLFNAVSGGAIVLRDKKLPGHFSEQLMYQSIMNGYNRRDITGSSAISSADTTKIIELAQIGVKLNSKIFIPWTRHSFQKNLDPEMKGDWEEVSRKIGVATIPARLAQQVNHSLYAARACLSKSGQGSLYTIANTSALNSGKMNSLAINSGQALMGDMSSRVKCLVMHSKPYFDLIGEQVTQKVAGVTDFALREGTNLTYGIPVLVTDSPALFATIGSGSTAYTGYYTLGLTEEAVAVENSEDEAMIFQPQTGKENIIINMQGEGAHNLEVKGFAWDTGTINPTDAALATSSNWTRAVGSVKNGPGYAILSR